MKARCAAMVTAVTMVTARESGDRNDGIIDLSLSGLELWRCIVGRVCGGGITYTDFKNKLLVQTLESAILSKLVQALSARLLIASATILANARLGLLRTRSG